MSGFSPESPGLVSLGIMGSGRSGRATHRPHRAAREFSSHLTCSPTTVMPPVTHFLAAVTPPGSNKPLKPLIRAVRAVQVHGQVPHGSKSQRGIPQTWVGAH